MIWVYAVCDRPELSLPPRRGLAQAPLDAVREGDLLAVFSAHADVPNEPAADALWAYEQIVEELMTERTVLPMRFGTTLADAGALRDAIAARHDALSQRLEFVRDRVELGVRAVRVASGVAPTADARANPTGREFLRAKLDAHHAVGRAAAGLHEPLAARAVASSRRAGGDGEVLHATYLVGRDDVASFLGAVERLRADHPDVALLCTGPWPPYSFVGDPGPVPADLPLLRSAS